MACIAYGLKHNKSKIVHKRYAWLADYETPAGPEWMQFSAHPKRADARLFIVAVSHN
jgi:hypothetical protein